MVENSLKGGIASSLNQGEGKRGGSILCWVGLQKFKRRADESHFDIG